MKALNDSCDNNLAYECEAEISLKGFDGYLHELKMSIPTFCAAMHMWNLLSAADKARIDMENPFFSRPVPVYYNKVMDTYNQICKSFSSITVLSDARKRTIKARINDGYSYADFQRLFEMAEASSFLKGENDRGWKANFDWLIKDANMAKVLDGNYQDNPCKSSAQPRPASYDISDIENMLNNPY